MHKVIILFLLLFDSLFLFGQDKGITPFKDGVVQVKGVARAVVIGISDYQHEKIPDLNYAHRDAETFAAFLQSSTGGSIRPENLILLTNEEATIGKMSAALDWLLDVSEEGDKAFIYFSGHSDVETRTRSNWGFLLTYNSPHTSYIGGAYPVVFLQTVLGTLSDNGVQTTMITDACHAGKLAGSEIGGTQATVQSLANQFAKEVKIMSCQPNEFSLEGEQWGGGRGAFSYHLVEGLYGLADADDNQQITLREISRYLEDHVTKETAPHRQTPFSLGDPYTTLAVIDLEALTALQEKKKRELPVLDKIETKGFEDMLLSGLDTNIYEKYRRFIAAMDAGQLLEPKGSSAYDLYEELSQVDTLKGLHELMKRNLAAAFQDDAQQAINAYLEADSSEMNSLSRKDPKYFSYPKYLEKAAELLGPQHYAYNHIMCKKYYFEGLALTFNISTKGNIDSIYREALELQQKALEYEDMAPYVHKAIGDCYFTLKKKECLNYYRNSMELAPIWVIPYEKVGLYYAWQLHEYEKAEAAYKSALEIDSTYAWAWYRLGQLYQWKMYDMERAEKMYKKTVSLDSSHSLATVGLAQILSWHYKDPRGGIAILKKHEKWLHNSITFYAMLGDFYVLVDEYDNAEEAYKKRLELSPTSGTYRGLARFYTELGDYKEAEKCYLKAISIDPTDSYNYSNFAYFYQKTLWDNEKALPHLYKALSLDSLNLYPPIDIATIYAEKRDFKNAVDILQKYYLRHPHSWEYPYFLGRFFQLGGYPEKAIPHFEKVIEKRPMKTLWYGPAELRLAEAYLSLGRKEEAEELFQKIIDTPPQPIDAPSMVYTGIAYIGLGQLHEMERIIQTALFEKPDDAEMHYAAACLYSLADKKEKALEYLEKSFLKGNDQFEWIQVDFDIDNIRGLSEFKALMKKYFKDKMND